MKARRIVSILLIVSMLIFTATSAFAAPGKGNKEKSTPPGILKQMILSSDLSEEEVVELIKENIDKLPAGILKEIILGVNLSNDALEELYEEGFLDNLPSGILKNILSGDKDDDDEDDENEVEGIITDIDVEARVIEIDGEEYQLPEEIEIEIDGEEADFDELEVGMKVELEIEDDEAKIEAETRDEDEVEVEVEGTITAIDVENRVIEIDEEEYQLPEDIEVEIDGEEAEFDELEVGMKIELEMDEEEAEIEAESVLEGTIEIEGSITDIDLLGNYHIEIDGEEYYLDRDAQVTIGEEEASLKDLEVSMITTVILLEDVVIEVIVEYVVEGLEGSITGIDVADRYIEIDEDDYPLTTDAVIRVNDESGAIGDLKVGMEIQAELLNGEIVEISAQTQSEIEAQGTIMVIDIEEGYIVIGNDEYDFAQEVEVKVNDEDATLDSLLVGMTAEAELTDGEIVKIYAEVPDSEIVEGEITDLDLIGFYHLSIDGVKYDLFNEALVKLNEKNASLIDLEVGMRASVSLINNDIFFIDAKIINSENIEGEITDIDLLGIYHITLGEDEYKLSEEAEVTIDGEIASLDGLEDGMIAQVKIIDEIVTKISVETIIKVEGAITAISSTEESISIDEVEYNFADSVEIIIDEEEAIIGDLVIGMTLVAEMSEEDEIIKITAETVEEIVVSEVLGSISEINIEDNYISIDDEEYYLAQEIEMLIVNGQEAAMGDLVIAMDIEVELHNGLVAKIEADDSIKEFSGEIIRVSYTQEDMELTIETDTQDIVQYLVGENLEGSNNEAITLGDYGQFKTINNIIVEATIQI